MSFAWEHQSTDHQSTKLFAGGDSDMPGIMTRSALLSIGTVARFAPDETIFAEGDDATSFYKLLTGAVRLCRMLPDGRRQIMDFALPGDYFGVDGIDEYSLTAEALDYAAVIRIPHARLAWEIQSEPEQNAMLAILEQKLRDAQNHIVLLGRQTAKERVASFLRKLAQRYEAIDGGAIELAMTRQDIADYLGLTIETVCRAISDLKRAGIIGVPNRYEVILRDGKALETIARGGD